MCVYNQPSQGQLDEFKQGSLPCPSGHLTEDQIREAFSRHAHTSIMMVSRRAAQRVNTIVVQRQFTGQVPLTTVPSAPVCDSEEDLPYCGMRIFITENRDKASQIVNGQDATVASNRGNTILIQFPDNQRAFVYPVMQAEEEGKVTRYPFTPAYARTICMLQGQNLKQRQ